MSKRALRTRLDLLQPAVQECISNKQEAMKLNNNTHTRLRPFEAEDKDYTQLAQEENWQPVQQCNSQVLELELTDGKV